jgi:hypothetical protein
MYARDKEPRPRAYDHALRGPPIRDHGSVLQSCSLGRRAQTRRMVARTRRTLVGLYRCEQGPACSRMVRPHNTSYMLFLVLMMAGRWMDTEARVVIGLAWARGLWRDGRHGASLAAAGLA